MDTHTKWKFATPGNGAWHWVTATSDGSEIASTTHFPSVEDCMADAAAHGYANYRPTEAAYS
ncbi:MAG: hypothetical protein V4637_12010 [Pseudomonadota bacterium]